MARRKTPKVELACRRCKAVYDVSDMRPNTLFKCESCGALIRAPRKKGPPVPILAAAGGALVVAVVVIVLMSRGSGEQDEKKGARTEPDRTARADQPLEPAPPPKPKPKPKPKPEPVDPRLEALKKTAQAEGATAEDAYQVAEHYWRKSPSRYKSQIEAWAGIAVARNPNHKWAHEMLGHVEFLGEYISEKEKEKRLEDPWYKKAWDVREKKFLQDQQLRDLGLVYKASMPFVIAKERNKQKPLRDERELDELGAILTSTYQRFRSLFAERFKLLPFDGSRGEPRAIPVFWFDSEKTFQRAWNEVGGLRRSISPNAAAFYAPGKEEDYLEMMIFGYRDRRHQDRTFDNGKIAHEATHALEDYYQKPLSQLQTRESSGSWWFSEGLAEFNGSGQREGGRGSEKRGEDPFPGHVQGPAREPHSHGSPVRAAGSVPVPRRVRRGQHRHGRTWPARGDRAAQSSVHAAGADRHPSRR